MKRSQISPILKKSFVGLLAFTMICAGLAISFVSVSRQKNPEILSQVLGQVGGKIGEGQPFDEVLEEDLYNIKNLNLKSSTADIEIHAYDGPSLKLNYVGKVPKGTQLRLIDLRSDGDQIFVNFVSPTPQNVLKLQWDEDQHEGTYSDVALTAKVYIPRNFQGRLAISTTDGNLDISGVKATDISANLTNGDIDLHKLRARFIDLELVNGDINATACDSKGWNIRSVNGDTRLSLLGERKYRFEINSVSGNVKNSSLLEADPTDSDAGIVMIKNIAGDIVITKHKNTLPVDDDSLNQ